MSCSKHEIPDRAITEWRVSGTLTAGDFVGTKASAEIRFDSITDRRWLILEGEGLRGCTWRGSGIAYMCKRFSGRRTAGLFQWRDRFEKEFRDIATVTA